MEAHTQYYLFPSPEIEKLFANYETDIFELLKREGLDVSKGYAPNPAAPKGIAEREPVSVIILASAALAAVLTPTINKIISELARKKVLVQETICVPVEDSAGNVIKDTEGQPVVRWIERARFVETTQARATPHEVTIEGRGIKISLSQEAQEE